MARVRLRFQIYVFFIRYRTKISFLKLFNIAKLAIKLYLNNSSLVFQVQTALITYLVQLKSFQNHKLMSFICNYRFKSY